MDGIEGAAMLPVGIRNDIDEAFCFREDMSYQERAHGYLERCEVMRDERKELSYMWRNSMRAEAQDTRNEGHIRLAIRSRP